GLYDFSSHIPRLAHAQASDGISGKLDLDGPLRRLFPEFQIHPALHNAKQRLRLPKGPGDDRRCLRWAGFPARRGRPNIGLVVTVLASSPATSNLLFLAAAARRLATPGNLVLTLLKVLLAALRPSQRQVHGLAHALLFGRVLRALVEGQDDVRPQANLGIQSAFRAEEVRRAIQMRSKRDAFLGELS